jgi:hypothetical protein
VLKTKFMNMKKKLSEKFSNLSSYSKGTGGEPPETINFTILNEEIKEISGVQITGNQSRYDDDFEEQVDNGSENDSSRDLIHKTFQQSSNMNDLPLSYNVYNEDEIEIYLIVSPSQNNIEAREQCTDNATPAKLQQPPSTPLRCLKRKSDSESRNNQHAKDIAKTLVLKLNWLSRQKQR